MKQIYDIQRNVPEPGSEQIQGHRDFDGLLEQLAQQPEVETPTQATPTTPPRPRVRRLYWGAGLAVAAALAVVLIVLPLFQNQNGLTNTEDQYQAIAAAYHAERPYVDPPLPGIRNDLQQRAVTASEGGVIEFVNGSRIVVPRAAFVSDRGAAVTGEVEVFYREMHDPVDFFLSGIPMTYDSAGVSYTLESAGMMEIYAEQNGQRVRLAPGKSLDVELVSEISMPLMDIPQGYNIYELDTAARNWVYRDVDRQEVISPLDERHPAAGAEQEYRAELQQIDRDVAAVEAAIEREIPMRGTAPVRPVQSNSGDFVFDLDLSQYRGDRSNLRDGTLWQFAPGQTVRPEDLDRQWADVTIEALGGRDYRITFLATEPLVVIANPVLVGSDYDAALAQYERDVQAYETAQRAAREAREAARRNRLAELEEKRRIAALNYQEALDELRQQGKIDEATNEMVRRRVINRFSADRMGYWNCDRPLPPIYAAARVSFQDQAGNRFDNKTVFLVDKTRNTVDEFVASEKGTMLRFDRRTDKICWIVTDDNRLAVFKPEQFARLNVAPGETPDLNFEMEIIEASLEDERDVRRVLSL